MHRIKRGMDRAAAFVSQDTGTIGPGMSERDVYALWGAPAAVRRAGEYTYLFFQNGCEYTCGTMDVVTLQSGTVVDAIVRWAALAAAGDSHPAPRPLVFCTLRAPASTAMSIICCRAWRAKPALPGAARPRP